MVRASRILLTVNNVNGKGRSFIYEATLAGVDGAGNVAVLLIDYDKTFNAINPRVGPGRDPCNKKCKPLCHPYFKWGRSGEVKVGDKAYVIGQQGRLLNGSRAVTVGTVADNAYVDVGGWNLAESIVIDAPGYGHSVGAPILNTKGEVIGMQTTNLEELANLAARNDLTAVTDPGMVTGPSERAMRNVVEILALAKRKGHRKYRRYVDSVCDAAGSYYSYIKAYLGVAYDVNDGSQYDVTVDYTSGFPPLGEPRVRLGYDGRFLDTPPSKEVVGVRVLGLAGLNPADDVGIANGFYYVPGARESDLPLPVPLSTVPLPVSPLIGPNFAPGDIITHIDKVPLGNNKGQRAPSLITWRKRPEDQVSITYLRGGNVPNVLVPNIFVSNYSHLLSQSVCLRRMPALMDYPWYNLRVFPQLLDTGVYPGFTAAPGQLPNPQYPARDVAGGGLFVPAI